jgi:tRNA A-37 threonylcarbamoyl transferase component Bud32
LEVLDLSNNKITTVDAKISNLTNLKFLNLSNNQIMALPQAILKLDQLQVLNISSNPLNIQFEPLLKKENQSDFKLKSILKACFDTTNLTLEPNFPKFIEDKTQTKTDRPVTTNTSYGSTTSYINANTPSLSLTGQKKPSWLNEKEEVQEDNSSSNTIMLKKQLSETENILSKEQQKVIELTKELEILQKSFSQDKFSFKSNSNKGSFDIDESITKYLEMNYKELDIGEKISQGGFSIVYQGFYRSTPVAIKKIFNPDITTELMDELSNEITMLNKLRHPNIVLLMGICSKPPNLCIITEFLQNQSLYNLLHLTKIEVKPQTKLEMARDIAIALNFLHLSQIVHRDIKSHNILLDDRLKIKLCDFGLARNESELNKGTMKFGGTPTYMAPEIFQKKAYDKKIDIFAFGTLLWELFARKVPFEGLEPSDVMQRVMAEEPLSMSGIHKKIAQLVAECRATDPKKRPDFNYVVEVLENIVIS